MIPFKKSPIVTSFQNLNKTLKKIGVDTISVVPVKMTSQEHIDVYKNITISILGIPVKAVDINIQKITLEETSLPGGIIFPESSAKLGIVSNKVTKTSKNQLYINFNMDFFTSTVITDYFQLLDIVAILGGYASSASILVKGYAVFVIMRYLYYLS